jgi:hypothetical protein
MIPSFGWWKEDLVDDEVVVIEHTDGVRYSVRVEHATRDIIRSLKGAGLDLSCSCVICTDGKHHNVDEMRMVWFKG